ncbi:alpha/beta hydrolase [Kitasatospora sp. NPDC089509]|uniref:alpha/beta hydrolase n=1 Tax=Kitasatospora sp. NPDC089509 TaxID=3364079 RepID=UPI0037F8739D
MRAFGRGRVSAPVRAGVPVRARARMVAVAVLVGLLAVSADGCSRDTPEPAGGTGTTGAGPTRSGAAPDTAATPLEPLPAAVPAALAPYYAQRPTWQPCDGRFECTTFRVPMDYDHPGDGDLTLSAARATAGPGGPGGSGGSDGSGGSGGGSGGDSRLGSLLLNPGGPGGSAIEYLEAVAGTYDRTVRARYDLIGLDPRGVGRSNPVNCLSGERMDAFTATDLAPGDQRAIDALVAVDQEFAEGCRKQAGAALGHLSTVESARDMDVLRALVGDERLNFVGKSYGTFLGATYAGLFPSKVGRVVLDGAMDPSLDAVTGNRTQAGGFETAWAAFARDCAGREDCPLGRTEQQVGDRLTALLAAVRAHPLPSTDNGRRLTGAQATTGVVQALYAEFLWPKLRTALTDAGAGDGTGLLKLSDAYYGREADGSYPNLMFANTAVNCLDLPAPFRSPEDVQRALPDFERVSPHFGRDMAWMALTCAYWPVRATGAAHTVRAAGAAPIVVVGTTRDPATPYDWARSLAGQLESGRLLTYDGDGHTAYGRHDPCVDGAVNRYLLTGEAPEPGKRCDR